MNTAFITHDACALHEMSPQHPESPKRLAAISNELKSRDLFDMLDRQDYAACCNRRFRCTSWQRH